MNWFFKLLLMLFMLLAVVCLALFDVNARAAPDEATTLREKDNEISALTDFATEIICIYEFQRCSALLTYTQASYDENYLDAEIYMIGACTPHGTLTSHGPFRAGGDGAGDRPSGL
jgi:hypothetical protein